jgi:hypothetical protein
MSDLRRRIEVLNAVHRPLRTLLDALRTGDPEEAFVAYQFTQSGDAWQDVTVSLAAAGRLGFSDPSWDKYIDDGAGSTGLYMPHFSAGLVNEVVFSLQLPHGHRGAANIHLHWAPLTAGAGDVIIEFEYTVSSRSGVTPASIVHRKTFATGGVAKQEQINGLVTVAGLGDSDLLICRLARLGNDAADTYAGAVVGLSVDAHVNLSTVGSLTEYPDSM